MNNPFIAELIGTMLLIIFGDGVVANVLLNKSKGQNSGWIVIATGVRDMHGFLGLACVVGDPASSLEFTVCRRLRCRVGH